MSDDISLSAFDCVIGPYSASRLKVAICNVCLQTYQVGIMEAGQGLGIVLEGDVCHTVLKVGDSQVLIQLGGLGICSTLFYRKHPWFKMENILYAWVSMACRGTATLLWPAFYPSKMKCSPFTYRSFKVAQCCEDNANVEMDLCGVCDGLHISMNFEKQKRKGKNISTSDS